MPTQLALKLGVLPVDWGMPVASAPQVDPPQGPGEPVGGRLTLHHPVAPARSLPVVSETEQVKAPRFFLPRLRWGAGRLETYQASLVRVEAKAVPTASLRQSLLQPSRMAL